MRAVVVYESMFGNTREVAAAVADGIADVMPVELVEVGVARPAHEVDDGDLLVVGAPTHAFGLSRPPTRQDAAQRGAHVPAGTDRGVREWLEGAEACPELVATFDTSVTHLHLPGRAGRAAARRLSKLGGRMVEEPRTFAVEGTTGPLVAGEAERARAWGARVARAAAQRRAAVAETRDHAHQ